MRVLVTGGRDYNDLPTMEAVIADFGVTELAHGCAPGADSLAGAIAKARGIPIKEYPADWNQYGKSAGIIRNQYMLSDFKPDAVIAFKGGKGTTDMVNRAIKQGYQIIDVDFTPDV